MTYYHDLITEKSWKLLQDLRSRYDFLLIGGWAVYLYTHGLKSRDIDFICSYETLEKLKAQGELHKNERLKKYEIHADGFDIDIYVPFFSVFPIPAEDLLTMSRSLEGFHVLSPEALLILKQHAFSDRQGSAKGEKDRLDIIALLLESIDLKKYRELLKTFQLTAFEKNLHHMLSSIRDVPELGLREHLFSQLKKKING